MKTTTTINNAIHNSIISNKLKCILILCILFLTQNSCQKETCTYYSTNDSTNNGDGNGNDDGGNDDDDGGNDDDDGGNDDDGGCNDGGGNGGNPPPVACIKGMDVVFAIDYTGSMSIAIKKIQKFGKEIANTIVTKSNGDYRLGLALFDEAHKGKLPKYFDQLPYTSLPSANKLIISKSDSEVKQYLTVMENLKPTNLTTFNTQLAKLTTEMKIGSGHYLPEPGGLLADKIVNSSFAGVWRENVAKVVIIITDISAGGYDERVDKTDDEFLTMLAEKANTAGIQFILIASKTATNYETKLIANNIGGLKSTSANFANVAPDIINQVNNLCDNNK